MSGTLGDRGSTAKEAQHLCSPTRCSQLMLLQHSQHSLKLPARGGCAFLQPIHEQARHVLTSSCPV